MTYISKDDYEAQKAQFKALGLTEAAAHYAALAGGALTLLEADTPKARVVASLQKLGLSETAARAATADMSDDAPARRPMDQATHRMQEQARGIQHKPVRNMTAAELDAYIVEVRAEGDAARAHTNALIERAAAAHGTELREAGKVADTNRSGNRVTVRLIRPGWGSSGYYSEALLQRDGPRAFAAGTQMYLDHPTREEDAGRPERSIRDLAGKLVTDARWAGDGLYAEAEIYPHASELVRSVGKDLGVSIRAMGEAKPGEAEGRRGQIVERITDAQSVDFVTKAGAGGAVLSA
jgi:hypothetical protein